MTTPTLDPVVMEYVDRMIDELLRARGGMTFTPDHADRIDSLEGALYGMKADKSLGRIFNGPLWLSGASVLNGTVTAEKISVNTLEAVQAATGTLNVTGTLTMAAAYPALSGARIVLTSSMIAGYNASDQQTFRQNIDGSGFVGIGATQMSWTTGGVLTVPAAAIGSLTIADVGTGTFNSNFDAGTGRVRAGTALQRVELTSAGIAAYNTGGTQTFLLSAATGSLTHTGTYTIQSAASGSRIEMTNVGIRGYNGATNTFELLSSNGSGFFGAGSNTISWSSGGVSIGGVALSSGKITATHLNVTTLSSITANMGTITAGTISAGTVNAGTITTGTLNGALLGATTVANGAIASLAASKLTTDSISTATLTLSSSGKIAWGGGASYIDANDMILDGDSTNFPALRLYTSGSQRGVVYSTTSVMGMYATGSSMNMSFESTATGSPAIYLFDNRIQFALAGASRGEFDEAGRLLLSGNVFPGGNGAADAYLTGNGTDIGFGGVPTAAGVGASQGYFSILINGTLRKVQYYAVA